MSNQKKTTKEDNTDLQILKALKCALLVHRDDFSRLPPYVVYGAGRAQCAGPDPLIDHVTTSETMDGQIYYHIPFDAIGNKVSAEASRCISQWIWITHLESAESGWDIRERLNAEKDE